MKEFLITFFFGWLGVHRFMKKQYVLGVVYLLTLGVFGIGWVIDTIIALINLTKRTESQATMQPQENTNQCSGGWGVQPSKRLVKSFDTKIVGTFAKCDLDSDETRQHMIGFVKPKWELELKFWRYKGEPAYYVCHPNGTDLGNLRSGLAKILYEEYSDCDFEVTAIERTLDERNDCMTYKIRIDIYKK